mmetsp:Transcript_62515/g.118239  ORF Transcript_62515/g.118239 Transcript_62515/m.118239 type:complete len:244 (-) Transcript_62515:175-906(-)
MPYHKAFFVLWHHRQILCLLLHLYILWSAHLEVALPTLLRNYHLAQDLDKLGSVVLVTKLALPTEELDDARRLRGSEESHALRVVHLVEIEHRSTKDSFLRVDLQLALYHNVVEKLLDPLVCKVDEHLLETIGCHVFEAKYVKESDDCSVFPSPSQAPADELNQVLENPRIHHSCNGVALRHRLRPADSLHDKSLPGDTDAFCNESLSQGNGINSQQLTCLTEGLVAFLDLGTVLVALDANIA